MNNSPLLSTIEILQGENGRLQSKVDEFRLALHTSEQQLEQQGSFFANLSHEIRTPLNAIVGMADLLADTPLNEQQNECVDVIRKGSTLLLGIINDVLDYSRIESGKVQMETLEMSPRRLAESAYALLVHRAWQHNLEPIVNVAPEVPAVVIGDPTHTTQILTNFLSNALKFTSSGSVTIDVTLETILENGDAVVRFAITDTGIGISSESLKALFQPFHQAEISTTRLYGGTGLGLAISKKLVNMMGGTLGVQSTVGKGSSFWAEIPFQVAQWEYNALQNSILSNKRVLIVDVHPGSRQAICNLVATAMGLPLHCENCSQALDFIIAGEQFDMAILASNSIVDESGKIGTYFINMCMTASVPLLIAIPQGQIKQFKPLLFTSQIDAIAKPMHFDAFLSKTAKIMGLAQTEDPEITNIHPVKIIAPKTQLSLLVVEDNSVNRKVIGRILERIGITPDMTTNGEEAVEAMAKQHYDMVLMDCQMPVMDGWQATIMRRQQEAKSGASRVIIVALTADAMAHDREKCMNCGMDDYMAKPVRPQDIAAMLKKHCGYEPPAPPVAKG